MDGGGGPEGTGVDAGAGAGIDSGQSAGSLDTSASDSVASVDVGSLDLSNIATVEVSASRSQEVAGPGSLDLGGTFSGPSVGSLDTQVASAGPGPGSLDLDAATLSATLSQDAPAISFSQTAGAGDYARAAVVAGVALGLANNALTQATGLALAGSSFVTTGGFVANMESLSKIGNDLAHNFQNTLAADPKNIGVYFAGHTTAAPAADLANDGALPLGGGNILNIDGSIAPDPSYWAPSPTGGGA